MGRARNRSSHGGLIRLRRSAVTPLVGALLVGLLAGGCNLGAPAASRSIAESAGGGGDPATDTGTPNTESADDESQGELASPISNTGALLQTVPIDVPPGIGTMTPKLSLAYSSQSAVGIAGVGWDLPLPAITLSIADGARPRSVPEDVARFDPNTPVERYTSSYGNIAVLKQGEDWGSSTKLFTFNPTNDYKVEPVEDAWAGDTFLGGDAAAWQVTGKDGTKYRFGFWRHSSISEDEGTASERKVAWLLDHVEDVNGNVMRYYYDEYPGGDATYRHPVLRAIEYGIPASDPYLRTLYVVSFRYRQSPAKRHTYHTGTRLDQSHLLDDVCVYNKTHVVTNVSGDGATYFTVNGVGQDGTVDDSIGLHHCYELTYDFEDAEVPDSYTGRPLLTKVQKMHRGKELPPWEFSYTEQGNKWVDVYGASLASPPKRWTLPDGVSLDRSTHGTEQNMGDLNGDGIVDIIEGTPDGVFNTLVAQDADGAYRSGTRANPLAVHGTEMTIKATPKDANQDTTKSDCWKHFEYDLRWQPNEANWPGGLGYVRPLTASPENWWDIYWTYVPPATVYDEGYFLYNDDEEPMDRTLGAFQFLDNAYYGPAPKVVSTKDSMDKITAFGVYRGKSVRNLFDWRTSDCKDSGDKVDIDYCWEIGTGAKGTLGDDLQCFDSAGLRWFTAGSGDEFRSYSGEMWKHMDLDGDGLLDLVFAAPIIQRGGDGALRNLSAGVNDYYWARGTKDGWEKPVYWSVPNREGSHLPSGAEFVHGTQMLSARVSTNTAPSVGSGVSLNVGVGPGGWSVSAAPIVAGNTLPAGVGFGSSGALARPGASAGKILQWAGVARGVAASSSRTQPLARSSFSSSISRSRIGQATNFASAAIKLTGAGAPAYNLIPRVGLGLSVTNRGVRVHVPVPIFGDLFGDNPAESTSSYQYQGLADVNGDGRPDFVSSRYDAGPGINGKDLWLVALNNGNGFDDPQIFPFGERPLTELGSISETSTLHLRYKFGPLLQAETLPQGRIYTYHSLVDMNGDGLADMVSSHPHEVDGDPVWVVYFNEGDGFGKRVDWRFTDWDSEIQKAVPECKYVGPGPRIQQTAFGIGDHLNDVAFSRQVQGLYDVNGDGLVDFWMEMPAPTVEGDDYCSYYLENGSFEDLGQRTSPYELSRGLYVWLNTGSGFDQPVPWVGPNGYSLSGTKTNVEDVPTPSKSRSQTVVGTADLDNDGAVDLVRADEQNPGQWMLFPLEAKNPDRLSTSTSPYGGKLHIDYDYHVEPGGDMGRGQWVVASITKEDIADAAGRYVSGTPRMNTERFVYEGGKYSREHRQFLGFEFVYRYADGARGYTLTRYYMEKELGGIPYCREVRATANSGGAAARVATVASEQRAARRNATSGGHPAGYTAAAALGNSASFGAIRHRRSNAEDDSAQLSVAPLRGEGSQGETADGIDLYSVAPDPEAADDPSQSATENATFLSQVAADNADPGYADGGVDESSPRDITSTSNSSPPTDGVSHESMPQDLGSTSTMFDVPRYADCSSSGTTVHGSLAVSCSPQDIEPHDLHCGDTRNGDRLVKESFTIYHDYSGIPLINTPRIRMTVHKLYDAQGSNPLVTAASNEYDDYGNVTSLEDHGDVDKAGDERKTVTRYLAPNRAENLVGLPCEETDYDQDGNVVRQEWYGYDLASPDGSCAAASKGLLTSTRKAISSTETIQSELRYTAEGMVEWSQDASGTRTDHVYDATWPWMRTESATTISTSGTPKTIRVKTSYFGVNATVSGTFGLVASETDENGAVTQFGYDALGRPTSARAPGETSNTQTWSYADLAADGARLGARNRVVRVRLDAARTMDKTEHFDGFGRVYRTEVTAPENRVGATEVIASQVSYDSDGRVVRAHAPRFLGVGAASSPLTTTYDLLGRITSVVQSDGARSTTRYDRSDKTEWDPRSHKTVTSYDAHGNPAATTQYLGGAVHQRIQRRYRSDGVLESMTDMDGNEWTFEHDLLGRTVRSSDPNSGVTEVVFDALGRPLVVLPASFATSGTAIETRYDDVGRPLERIEWTNAVLSPSRRKVLSGTQLARTAWEYDEDAGRSLLGTFRCSATNYPLSRLSRVVQSELDGGSLVEVSTKEYCYDIRGRVSQLRHTVAGTTYDFSYSYDVAGNLTQVVYPDGDAAVFDYDDAGHEYAVTMGGRGLVLETFRDAAGRLVRRELGNGAAQWACHNRGTDSAARVRRLVTGESGVVDVSCGASSSEDQVVGVPFHELSYEYNEDGLVATKNEALLSPTSGALDSHTSRYTYDDAHRLTAEDHDGVRRSYVYDRRGNLVSLAGVAQAYGASGRTTNNAGPHAIVSTDSGFEFNYDDAGRVRRWTGPSTTTEYRWTPSGLMTTVTDEGGAVRAKFSYDEEGRRVVKATTTGSTIYVGNGYRVLPDGSTETRVSSVAIELGTGASSRVYYSVKDLARSTSVLLDEAQNVVQIQRYAPYGGIREATTNDPHPADGVDPLADSYLWGGKELDPQVHPEGTVYDFGFRPYLATVGRWLKPDDRYADGLNPYAFTLNNPTTYADPTGHSSTNVGLGHCETGGGNCSGMVGGARGAFNGGGAAKLGGTKPAAQSSARAGSAKAGRAATGAGVGLGVGSQIARTSTTLAEYSLRFFVRMESMPVTFRMTFKAATWTALDPFARGLAIEFSAAIYNGEVLHPDPYFPGVDSFIGNHAISYFSTVTEGASFERAVTSKIGQTMRGAGGMYDVVTGELYKITLRTYVPPGNLSQIPDDVMLRLQDHARDAGLNLEVLEYGVQFGPTTEPPAPEP